MRQIPFLLNKKGIFGTLFQTPEIGKDVNDPLRLVHAMKLFIPLFAATRFPLSFLFLAALGMVPISQAGTLYDDYTVSAPSLSEAPSASVADLAQMYYDRSSGTGTEDALSQHAELLNGLVGNEDGDTFDAQHWEPSAFRHRIGRRLLLRRVPVNLLLPVWV